MILVKQGIGKWSEAFLKDISSNWRRRRITSCDGTSSGVGLVTSIHIFLNFYKHRTGIKR